MEKSEENANLESTELRQFLELQFRYLGRLSTIDLVT
jgi:hypothetical protein